MVGKCTCIALGLAAVTLASQSAIWATDHFVTIGGGYSPSGNQASMEANVLFFQDLLVSEKRGDKFQHHIFFSDGTSPEDDVQMAADQNAMSDTLKIVAELFEWKTDQLSYRNHEIQGVVGTNRADDVRSHFLELADGLIEGDRLFIYVTAHGGKSSSKENAFDTTLYGWQKKTLKASDFATWLDRVPAKVPVVMVMAQCYCGGFSHAIFQQGNSRNPLADGLRCGFFAQRHDLPAAGCRPDISNDREYSSYFWGAIAGRSRNGNPIEGVDRDGDGRVSLSEAHVYAVVSSETIDIPLRSSESLLRVYSQLKPTEEPSRQSRDPNSEKSSMVALSDEALPIGALPIGALPIGALPIGALPSEMAGTLEALVSGAADADVWMVRDLAEKLGFDMTSTIQDVQQRLRQSSSGRRRGRGRGGMQGYDDMLGRLKDEIVSRWPEVEKIGSLGECDSMGLSVDEIDQEIRQWDSYQQYQSFMERRNELKEASLANEFNQIHLKRLVHCIETIVLAKNLPVVATPEVVQRYQQILELEQMSL